MLLAFAVTVQAAPAAAAPRKPATTTQLGQAYRLTATLDVAGGTHARPGAGDDHQSRPARSTTSTSPSCRVPSATSRSPGRCERRARRWDPLDDRHQPARVAWSLAGPRPEPQHPRAVPPDSGLERRRVHRPHQSRPRRHLVRRVVPDPVATARQLRCRRPAGHPHGRPGPARPDHHDAAPTPCRGLSGAGPGAGGPRPPLELRQRAGS